MNTSNIVIVPEGLRQNREEVSSHYRANLEYALRIADETTTLFLAPGNTFSQSKREDLIAADFLDCRADGKVYTCTDLERNPDGYLDTLDNALLLKKNLQNEGSWPLGPITLVSNSMHQLRSWACFRLVGFSVQTVISSTEDFREEGTDIVSRLWYYDYPAIYFIYEGLALHYDILRYVYRELNQGIRHLVNREIEL